MENVQIQRVMTMDSNAVNEVEMFLSTHELAMELPTGVLLAARENGVIVGTGALSGQIIKMLAVDDRFRGTNLIGRIVSELMGQAYQTGQDHLFIYTKPGNEKTFENLGFYQICRTEQVVLLENRRAGFEKYFESATKAADLSGLVGAVVMNCNPFTLGHQYLIETAASEVNHLLVFVLSEDLSAFPASARLQLVKDGVGHLGNVTVLDSGPYMVSSATFPSYFLEEGHDRVAVQTEVDAVLFASKIAPQFGIQKRFLGEEPYSRTTAAYNSTLERILTDYGICVRVIARKSIDGEIISASKVRAFIGSGKIERALEMVPETTGRYLLSDAASEVIERIKRDAHKNWRV